MQGAILMIQHTAGGCDFEMVDSNTHIRICHLFSNKTISFCHSLIGHVSQERNAAAAAAAASVLVLSNW